MENAVDELLMQLVRLPGVKQRVVDIGGPVVKGGKEEPQLRRCDGLADGAVELVVAGEVAQLRLAQLDGAHST